MNPETLQNEDIKSEIKTWNLSRNGAFQDSVKLDTLQTNFQIYNPVYKRSITSTYVGNYGTPYLNNNFFGRNSSVDFFFLKTRDVYVLTPDSLKYYNTTTPYTLLEYSQSENKNRKSENRFNVLHSQNVSPYLNFTFLYDQAKSEGQYKNQSSKNSIVSLSSSYTKDVVLIHSGFIANSIGNNENGGIANDSLIFNGQDSDLLNTKLSNSSSKFTNFYFFTNGEYRFGKYIESEEDSSFEFRPILGLIYSFEYEQNRKEFLDEEDQTNTFFKNTYYGDSFSKDSVRYRKITNVFQLKQYENKDRKFSFGKRAFISQELVRISMPSPSITQFVLSYAWKYSNVYVGGGIFRQTGNFWKWNAEGKLCLIGRNIGQTQLSGVISKPMNILKDTLASLNIRGSIENRMPDFFQEEFYSNHFRWKNDFKMLQKMVVEGSFLSPSHKLEFGANYAILNNYIYNDTLGIPSQTSKEILVLSAYIDKDFSAGNWHLRTRLLWQKASNSEFIRLPDFSTFTSAYYKFVLSKVMFSQIGVDLRYNTAYYANAYQPATGLFYLQNEKKLGNYPYIDVYASFKLKRTMFFFKMINIGTEFLNKEYFTTLHYPMNRSTFRLGVSWSFYD